MATHIQLHRSCEGGATPDVSTMFEGEPAVNLTDRKLWVRGCTSDLITFVDGQTASLGSLYSNGSLFASDVTKLGFSAGANIALSTSTVGNEKRVTISSSDRASTIAGSNTEVQFNASDGFSADSGFVYNETANRLGVDTTSPRSTIEAGGVVMGMGFSGATGVFSTGITLGGAGSGNPGRIWVDNVFEFYAGNSQLILAQDDKYVYVNNTNRDIDFVVDGDVKNHLLYTDAGADKVGVLTNVPRESLEVQGTIMASAGVSGATGIFITGLTAGKIWSDTGLPGGGVMYQYAGPLKAITLFGTSLGQRAVIINEDGADLDFQVKGDVKSNVLYVNAGTDKVGINTNAPRESLEVQGTVMASGGISGATATFGGDVTLQGAGDVSLKIFADSDNVGESDNPLIHLRQDGTGVQGFIGLVGINDQFFTGSLANATYIEAAGAAAVQFSSNNLDNLTIRENRRVGIKTNSPRGTLEVVGNIMATGFSGATGNFASGVTSSGMWMQDSELSRPRIRDYSEQHFDNGVKNGVTFDFQNGNVQTVIGTGSGATSNINMINLINPPPTGSVGSLTAIVVNGGAMDQKNFNSDIQWVGGTGPTLTSTGHDILSFMTTNAGVTYYGFVGGLNFS